ncbi:MAG: C40 family peptidase [Spirochaetes bacterium]|nr:C40 family peptidase [Spirochaetota bacterium]
MRRTFAQRRNMWLFLAVLLLAAGMASCAPPNLRRGWMFQSSGSRRNIVETARQYVGTPYRYGGESPGGFDCSGYVMYVYQKNGIDIPRTAQDQFRGGRRITRRHLKPGDLVFFQTSRTAISHVGIYAGRNRFIHAPKPGKKVGYASLANSYWSRRFRGAVTYLN